MSTVPSYVTPSPNELCFLMHEQTMQRRKLRLQQVRQQGQTIAKDIRVNVALKKQKVLQDIAAELNKQHVVKKQEKFYYVQQEYCDGLKNVAVAHDCAAETDTDQALRDAILQKEQETAKRRHHTALHHLHQLKSMEENANLRVANRRMFITRKEKVRAKRIAMLPKPESSSSEKSTSTSRSHSTTYSSNQSSLVFVERATKAETNAFTDAKTAALAEEAKANERRFQLLSEEVVQKEKAKFRHLAALRQTKMQNEYQSLENQLKSLQKKDALKRRETLSYVPHAPSLDVSLQDLMA